jgi:hypothetical protein
MPSSTRSQLTLASPFHGPGQGPGDEEVIARHLYPGEQILHSVRGVERPFWALILLAFAFLVHRRYLVVATDRRLLLIADDSWFGGDEERGFASLPWGELERAELKEGFFWRTLRISAHAGRWRRSIRVRPDYAAHEGIVSAWERRRRRPAR